MSAVLEANPPQIRNPFDLADEAGYRQWRAAKLAQRAQDVSDLIVEVNDPCALTPGERQALLQRCARWNMAVYRCAERGQDNASARALGHQLGLRRLDRNWLADDDGISSITAHRPQPIATPQASPAQSEHAASGSDTSHHFDAHASFVPYTDRPIKWHTDGYYHPDSRRIRAMILHCVRPARDGGVNALLDHELAYIALRDASPRWTRALMAPDAMTIPGREDATGVARAAQTGPVFSVDPVDASLHMRYTARARSIEWKADVATQKAMAFLARYLNDDNADVVRVRLQSGMGIVANNVLHNRSGFVDDPAHPRLLLRARYLDRIDAPELA